MSKAKHEIILPTPEEYARIRTGIAADPDAWDLTPEEMANRPRNDW